MIKRLLSMFILHFIMIPSWIAERERKMQGRILGDDFSAAFHKYKPKGMLVLMDGKYARCN